jgi:hypothetical protein
MAREPVVGKLFTEAAAGMIFDPQIVRIAGKRVEGIPPLANVVHEFAVDIVRRGFNLERRPDCESAGA